MARRAQLLAVGVVRLLRPHPHQASKTLDGVPLASKLIAMRINWSEQTDEELIAEAPTGRRGQGAVVEANRRLRNSIDALRRSNDWYSGAIVFLTFVLTVLTGLMVYKEFWGAPH